MHLTFSVSRLRAQAGPGGVLTEYNPNYEFGGETYTLTDLKVSGPSKQSRLSLHISKGSASVVLRILA